MANWRTRLVRINQETVVSEEMLDFEALHDYEGFLTFKSYDANGNVVLFSIDKEELQEELMELFKKGKLEKER